MGVQQDAKTHIVMFQSCVLANDHRGMAKAAAVLRALHGLDSDELYRLIDDALQGRLVTDTVTKPQPFTVREQQVLTGVSDGLTNRQIGTAMGISESTVKTHIRKIFEKTGTRDRAGALICAMREGWFVYPGPLHPDPSKNSRKA